MNKVFFGIPFKSVILAMLFLFIGIIGITPLKVDAQNWKDDRLLLDLKSGGAEMFKEIAPSVVQVFNMNPLLGEGGGGSGYVIDKEGHTITNKHVVGKSKIVEIAFFGDEDTGERHRAVVIGEDPQLDLAIIKIETDPENLKPIKLADTEKIQIGDVVATAGSPGGDAGVIDWGEDWMKAGQNWLDFFNYNIGVVDEIVDFPHAVMFYSIGRKWSAGYGQYYGSGVQYLFHVSASINHGNSGGPCINAYGEAIGTNTWGLGGENVGCSVPTNLLKRGAREIIEYGRAMTPWCGIICHNPVPPYKWLALDSPMGLTNEYDLWFDVIPEKMAIYHVNPYSPAYKAGLKEGDVLLTVDNKKFENVFDLYKYFLNARIGQKVTFMIERHGVGLPPITVELVEKKVRYDTVTIDTYTMSNVNTPYNVTLTY